MKLSHIRSLIRAVLTGQLAEGLFVMNPVFNLAMPTACPDVPAPILDPRRIWADPMGYDAKANHLNSLFVDKRESLTSVTLAIV